MIVMMKMVTDNRITMIMIIMIRAKQRREKKQLRKA